MARSLTQTGFGRRLIGWIAAYALVLHAVVAGAVATQLAAASHGGAGASFELCLAGPDGSSVPGHGQSQHENCAIHCLTIASGAPALLLAFWFLFPLHPRTPVRSLSLRRHDLLRRAGLGSRAPPLLA